MTKHWQDDDWAEAKKCMKRWKVSAKWMNHAHDCTAHGIKLRCHAGCCTSGAQGQYWPAKAYGSAPYTRCGNLGPTGCRLEQTNRPIVCLLYPLIVRDGFLVLHQAAMFKNNCCKGNFHEGPKLIDALATGLISLFGKAQYDRVRADVLAGRDSYFDLSDALIEQNLREHEQQRLNQKPTPRCSAHGEIIGSYGGIV